MDYSFKVLTYFLPLPFKSMFIASESMIEIKMKEFTNIFLVPPSKSSSSWGNGKDLLSKYSEEMKLLLK